MLDSVRKTFNGMDVGTRWAYVGNILGIGSSIALNASEAASRGHGRGPVIVAGSVPVFLYVALEILARKKITGWKQIITYPGFITVVAVTFVTSYQDQVARLTTWEFDYLSAHILPVGIDGLMVVAAVALLEGAAKPKPQVEVETSVEVQKQVGDRLSDAEGEYATWDGTQWIPDRPEPVEVVTHVFSKEPWNDPYRGATDRPVEPEPEPVKAPEKTGWRRGARGSGRPRRADPLRDEWLRRLNTEEPMTPEDLAAKDGKGINSARSKIQRWRKDYDRGVREGTLGEAGSGAGDGADPATDSGSVDDQEIVVEPASMVEEDAEPPILPDFREKVGNDEEESGTGTDHRQGDRGTAIGMAEELGGQPGRENAYAE